jgi:hypothetical protein
MTINESGEPDVAKGSCDIGKFAILYKYILLFYYAGFQIILSPFSCNIKSPFSCNIKNVSTLDGVIVGVTVGVGVGVSVPVGVTVDVGVIDGVDVIDGVIDGVGVIVGVGEGVGVNKHGYPDWSYNTTWNVQFSSHIISFFTSQPLLSINLATIIGAVSYKEGR